jgi:hypothetical protein
MSGREDCLVAVAQPPENTSQDIAIKLGVNIIENNYRPLPSGLLEKRGCCKSEGRGKQFSLAGRKHFSHRHSVNRDREIVTMRTCKSKTSLTVCSTTSLESRTQASAK